VQAGRCRRAGAGGQVQAQVTYKGVGPPAHLQARRLHVVHHDCSRGLVVAGGQAIVGDQPAHNGVHLQRRVVTVRGRSGGGAGG
jgi:hypothetical protein